MPKKDRLLHPREFLTSMLANWQHGSEPHRLTTELLSYVEATNMDAIRQFHSTHEDDGEALGSAFWQVVSFARSYLERYDDAPRAQRARVDD